MSCSYFIKEKKVNEVTSVFNNRTYLFNKVPFGYSGQHWGW